jgi:hypothetical protein
LLSFDEAQGTLYNPEALGSLAVLERAVSGESCPMSGRRFDVAADPSVHVQKISVAGNDNIRASDRGECEEHLISRIAALR